MVLSVQFEHGGRRFELRPAWPALVAAPRDGFERVAATPVPSGPWPRTPRWLASCPAWRLRALAEEIDGGPGALQQRDAQLHDAITRLLQQGRLRLFELTRRPLPDEQEAALPRVASPAVTPSMLRAAPADDPAPDHAATATPATDPAQPPIDQDRQAAVLRRAAETGVPFCEECERRRQPTPPHPRPHPAPLPAPHPDLHTQAPELEPA